MVDKFFYWLRASMLETRRVAYWWAERMLNTERPLEEKMTLFWHGHFATSEDKVRDVPQDAAPESRPSAATPPATSATS